MKQDYFTAPAPFKHRIAYTEWGGDSSLPPVICVHGLTRNGRDFDRLAEALAHDGRRVICPTLPGRGTSDDLPDPRLYNYGQYIGDINAVLNDKGIADVHWVGTSMGGLIGMTMAAAPDNPIRSLVLNDVGPFIPMPALKRIADYVGMPTDFTDTTQLERYVRQIYAPSGIAGDEDWRHIVEHGFRVLPNGHLALAHDTAIAEGFRNLKEDVDLWKVYDAITCPTLLLRGETSDVLSAEVAEEMTRRGPRAELITYKGIGHAPALMDGKQIGDIRDFIKRRDEQRLIARSPTPS